MMRIPWILRMEEVPSIVPFATIGKKVNAKIEKVGEDGEEPLFLKMAGKPVACPLP